MFEVKCPCKTDHFTYSVGSCCFYLFLFSLPGRKKKIYIYIGSSFLVCSGCASVYTYLTDLYPVISVSSPTKSKEIDYK